MSTARTIAIVTPTFPPDLERCELLVESVRRFGGDIEHHLVVDRRHARRFHHLVGPRTTITHIEDLLPGRSFLLDTRRSIRIRDTGPPVRGWVVQQVCKIALAAQLGVDVVLLCDSDTCFVRPFTVESFLDHGRVRLIDVDFSTPDLRRWTSVACELLGVARSNVPARNHVGAMVTWRPAIARAMTEQIGDVTGRDWREVILRRLTVSEYVTYGVFVRSVLGYDASGHAPSTAPMVHLSYGYDLAEPAGLDRFFADLADHHLAVMVHSKDGVEVSAYREHVEAAWSRWTSC